jgi:predicted TIM-barrel fold metal-dependent hydrolase
MPDDVGFGGACDCHVHIVGPTASFPQIPARCYTADAAPLGSLRAAAEPLGIARFVIVQASFYGTDNACLLHALDSLGDKGRGVAMLDPGTATPERLRDYACRGVCGLRVNLYSQNLAKGRRPASDLLDAAVEQAASMGWHVEIVARLSTLLTEAKRIADSKAVIVIDHYGLPGEFRPESCEGRRLLELFALPHVWVKLAAPYRIGADPLSTRPPADWLKILTSRVPERCVWGSDWPHTPLESDQRGPAVAAPYRPLDYAALFREFSAAVADVALAERILVKNPERLYGFPPHSEEDVRLG